MSPTLEGLETRLLLYATSGGEWAYGSRITYSFIPDGTSIGGTPSVLFQTLDASFATASWQAQIQKAAAVWEAVANINLALVSDNGTDISAAGKQQGDTRFGDIRIGGMAQSSGQLAMAYASPPFNGGTLAGDVFFNTIQSWEIDGGTYDLETVAIHELGHALGMDHSQINSAVMYAYYNYTKQSLTADDISGIRSIYGANQLDAFDAAASNNTFATATVVTPYINASKQILIPNLSLTSTSDPDFFYAVAPAGSSSTMTVSVQSSNLSSLSPSLWVYNSSPQFLGRTVMAASYGGTATFVRTGVVAGQGYYFRVVGADYGASGLGTYGLLVNFGTSPLVPVAPPYTVVNAQPDQGGGGSAQSTPDAKNDGGRYDRWRGTPWQRDAGYESDPSSEHREIITFGTLSGYGHTLSVGDPGAQDRGDEAPARTYRGQTASRFAAASFDHRFVTLAPSVSITADTGFLDEAIGSPRAARAQRLARMGELVDRVLVSWHSHPLT